VALLADHDALIELLKRASAEGGQDAVSREVQQRLGRADVALFLRLADLAEAATSPIERDQLVALSQQVMSAVEAAGTHTVHA
jgi:hypothetical protein